MAKDSPLESSCPTSTTAAAAAGGLRRFRPFCPDILAAREIRLGNLELLRAGQRSVKRPCWLTWQKMRWDFPEGLGFRTGKFWKTPSYLLLEEGRREVVGERARTEQGPQRPGGAHAACDLRLRSSTSASTMERGGYRAFPASLDAVSNEGAVGAPPLAPVGKFAASGQGGPPPSRAASLGASRVSASLLRGSSCA